VDWHQPHVGGVLYAAHHRSKLRAFVATSANAVACLHLRDGSIIWRKLLGPHDPVSGLAMVDTPATIVSLSRQAGMLRAWDQGDGALRWEAAVSGSSNVEGGEGVAMLAVQLPDSADDQQALAVAAHGDVQARQVYCGKFAGPLGPSYG
jgi:outer membrane protein assembly factor BamB